MFSFDHISLTVFFFLFQSVVLTLISAMTSVSLRSWRTAQWWKATCRSFSLETRITTSTRNTFAPCPSPSWPWSPTTFSCSVSPAWTAWAFSSPTSPSSEDATCSTTTPWSSSKWPAWKISVSTTWGTSPEGPSESKRTRSCVTWTQWTGRSLWMQSLTITSMGTSSPKNAVMFVQVSWRRVRSALGPASMTTTASAAGPPTTARRVRTCQVDLILWIFDLFQFLFLMDSHLLAFNISFLHMGFEWIVKWIVKLHEAWIAQDKAEFS